MGQNLKKRSKKIITILISSFAIMFVFRFIYGYTITPVDISFEQNQMYDNSIQYGQKNYASKKYEKSAAQSSVQLDQKYEKIADISTKSNQFENEEKEAREEIEKYKGLIQFEEKSGNKGAQKLNLLIGVPPENFDSLYNSLISIGKVQSKQITKKDKTNEYKELNARKASLEKIRMSLIDLKSKGGKIDEYMQLENRILEIEQQLQALGVSLGDFDDENEFCTVKFSIQEGKEAKISLIHRVKVAFEWTIKYYLAIMAILFFITFFAYLLVLIIDKLKVFEKIVSRKDQE